MPRLKHSVIGKTSTIFNNHKNKKDLFNYRCFSPSQMMQDLLDEGARCIILTSGTLSPIGSLKTELRIPFDVTLENPHIIKPQQIKVLTVNKGPSNIVLKSTYENRSSEAYIDSLGQLIFYVSKIIPHGVYVAFLKDIIYFSFSFFIILA
jgi:regulator of telomere elongation helicase 1